MPRVHLTGPVLVALVPLLLAACATQPGTSVPQAITVETPGCLGARCELSNDRGSWVLPATPGTVTVITSTTPLRLSCQGHDGQPATIGSSADTTPATGKGAVLGGAAGGAAVGVGFGAAALSFIPVLGAIAVVMGIGAGAAAGQAVEAQTHALHYPSTLTLPMACGAPLSAPGAAAPFGFQVRTLDAAAARAAGLVPPPGAAGRGAVLVTAVNTGSRAEALGLRAGDLVLEANGRQLQDAARLELALRSLAPGQALVLQVQREGRAMSVSLQWMAAP
ncbi:MAG: PDZ domain-containing protein [Rubrivivax sp.]|nr:PDZ domain-containing protein [Rubrivivax sp.]